MYFVSWAYNCGRTAAGLIKSFIISVRISVLYIIVESQLRDLMKLLIVCY